MKKYTFTSPQAYSVIAAIMMIGFLLVLTTSTLNLVLQEMQDGKGRQDYMKAYAGAEWAMELALLKIKEKGYGYYWKLDTSKMLGNTHKDVQLSYSFDSKVQVYTGNLWNYSTDIIPLFWIDDTGVKQSISWGDLRFDDLGDEGIIWNIVWRDRGMSGIWDFSESTSLWEKKINISWDFTITTETIGSLFPGENYLIVYNPKDSLWASLGYTLSVSWNDYFTTPKANILSTGKIWRYSQNLRTLIDNTEFLGILKYSIYSWN